MIPARTLGTLVLCLLVLASGGTVAAATALAPSPSAAPPTLDLGGDTRIHPAEDGYEWANETNLPESMQTDFGRFEVVRLFSGDADPERGSEEQVKQTNDSATAVEALQSLDIESADPSPLVDRWNRYMLQRFQAYHNQNGGPRNSIFPHEVDDRKMLHGDEPLYQAELAGDKRMMNDGYIEIMSVNPSTIVHERANQSGNGDIAPLYVNRSGRVLATADVKVEDIPSQKKNCGWDGCNPGDTKYTYHHGASWVDNGRLLTTTDDSMIRLDSVTDSTSGTFDFEYELPADLTGEKTFIVKADARVEIDRKLWKKEQTGTKEVECTSAEVGYNPDCADGNKTVPVYDWVHKETHTLDERNMTVTDSMDYYRPHGWGGFSPHAQVAHLPGGASDVRLTIPTGERDPHWRKITMESARPHFQSIAPPPEGDGQTSETMRLTEPVKDGTRLKLWARGDFDAYTEEFTVAVNGTEIYTGQTGAEDQNISDKHWVSTPQLPDHVEGANYLNVTVTTSGSVDTDEAIEPRVWVMTSYPSETWQGQSIQSQWRFFSGRDRGWDELWKAHMDGLEKDTSPVRPVYTHAYPSNGSMSVNGVQILDQTNSSRISSPTLTNHPMCRHSFDEEDKEQSSYTAGLGEYSDTSCNFNFPVANESESGDPTYRRVSEVYFRSFQPVNRFQIHGMVDGQSTYVEIENERTVERVSLSVDPHAHVHDDGTKHEHRTDDRVNWVPVTVTLTNAHGEPINTAERDLAGEYIQVNSSRKVSESYRDENGDLQTRVTYEPRQLQTDETGTVETRVYVPNATKASERSYDVAYESPDWWNVPQDKQAYTENTFTRPGEQVASMSDLINGAISAGAILLIPLVLMYYIAKSTGIDFGLRAYGELLGQFLPPKFVTIMVLGAIVLWFLL